MLEISVEMTGTSYKIRTGHASFESRNENGKDEKTCKEQGSGACAPGLFCFDCLSRRKEAARPYLGDTDEHAKKAERFGA